MGNGASEGANRWKRWRSWFWPVVISIAGWMLLLWGVAHAAAPTAATEDRLANYTEWLVVFTALLAFVSAVQGYFLYRSIDLARQEFAAVHRPRMIFRGAYTWPDGDPTEPVRVTFTLANAGDTDAKIIQSHVVCRWYTENELIPLIDSTDTHDLQIEAIKSGADFRSEVVADRAWEFLNARSLGDFHTAGLYLCGHLVYEDTSGAKRQMAFCRAYDPESRRFRRGRRGTDADQDYAD